MRYRPLGSDPADPRLGRFIPDDWRHVERYPLSALSDDDRPTRAPVVIGVNWYSAFDTPEQDEASVSSSSRRPASRSSADPRRAPCASSRGAALGYRRLVRVLRPGPRRRLRRVRLVALHVDLQRQRVRRPPQLWDSAKKRDEWPRETSPGDDSSTSVRAAAEVLAEAGHVLWDDSYADDDWQTREKYAPEGKRASRRSAGRSRSTTSRRARQPARRRARRGAVAQLVGPVPAPDLPPRRGARGVIRRRGEIAVPTDRWSTPAPAAPDLRRVSPGDGQGDAARYWTGQRADPESMQYCPDSDRTVVIPVGCCPV